jgi:GAF domain-containing protein
MVLEACSEQYAHLVGKVALEPGEGVAGWVARHRQPVFIAEDALADPRMRVFEEFEEDKYQSLVSLPLVTRSGDVLGVIAAHGEAPRSFSPEDQRFLLSSAALATSAIENARLAEERSRRVVVLERLVQLSRRIAEAETIETLLRDVVSRLLPLLSAASCRLYVLEPDRGRLRLRACSPASAGGVPVIPLPAVGAALAERRNLEALAHAARAGDDNAGGWLFVPLVVSGELLGLLAVMARQGDRFGPDDRDLAATVMAQAAVAMKKIQLMERLSERNLIKDFFDGLAGAEEDESVRGRARRLRWELEAPGLVLIARRCAAASAAGDDEGAWAAPLEAKLAAAFRGALIERNETGVRALIPCGSVSEGDVQARVRDVHGAVSTAEHPVSIGLSAACSGPAAYAVGFVEAAEAAQVAAAVYRRAGVVPFDELGPYKYLLRLALESGGRDRHGERLGALLDYDRTHRSQLFRTLEEYYRHRGRIAPTAASLYIHPNTLRQRLTRIATVTGLDPEAEDPLTIEMAMQLLKLREALGAS